jgi:hypothetical protein
MAEAGTPREQRQPGSAPWTDRLRDQLDAERERRYDDVFRDMEKAGHQGSHLTDWVEGDMIRAGRAESSTDRLQSADPSIGSYKLEGWQRDRYDAVTIREHLETAGHAQAEDWIAGDVAATGQNRSTTAVGRPYPSPTKELREWLNTDEATSIAQDMEVEGRATAAAGGRRTREEKITRSKLSDLVARDMQVVGTTSASWIESDMERSGHADPHLNREVMAKTHKQRETEAFMSARKDTPTPTRAASSPVQTQVRPASYSPFGVKPKAPDAETKNVVATAAKTEPGGSEENEEEEEAAETEVEAAFGLPVAAAAVVSAEEPFLPGTTPAHGPGRRHHTFPHQLVRATKKVLMPWKSWDDIA